MPELPEVETIRQGLESRVKNRIIEDVEIRSVKSFIGNKDDVIGRKVLGLKRRAKVLCICLEDDKNLLFHLKMTGQLIYRSKIRNPFAGGHPTKDWVGELPNDFTRIIFTFDDDSKLFFNDIRIFGWCKVLSGKQVREIFKTEYGPEPFSKEFTTGYLMMVAKRFPNRKVKQFITDQSIIAGIGNIYADESLFYAKISPLRAVKDIGDDEWKRLQDSIVKSLELGIKWGGASIDTYVNAFGEAGDAHLHTKVYRHTGSNCPDSCGGTVKKITLGGRGTHYCPACQR